MGILQITTDVAGQINVNPRRVKIISSDNLATVTAAGYLNPVSLEGYVIYNTDIIDMWYGATGTNQFISVPGTLGEFTATIANGVITLVQNVNPGNVLLPVVSGDFAVFNGTSGQIKDSGSAPSASAQPYVVTSPGSLTVGNFPQLNDANGTLNTGLPPSAASQAYVVVSPGGFTVNHLLKTSDVHGTLADAGFLASNVMLLNALNAMAAGSSITMAKVNGTEASNAVTASGVAGLLTTSSLSTAGGSSYAITWTNTFITATSVVLLTIAGGTNTTENITLKCVPGAGSATLTIYNNTAATSLNGTIFISYLVM